MFGFFKGKKENIVVPEWANFFTSSEYQKFIDLVTDYFKTQGEKIVIEDGVAIIPGKEKGYGQYGLQNISQRCRQYEQKDWKELVFGHFDAMYQGEKFMEEFNKKVDHYEQIKQYLGVRIYNTEYQKLAQKIEPVKRDVAEDVVAMLVYDLPTTVMNLQAEHPAKWGKTIDELFEVGLKNIRDNYEVDFKVNDSPGFPIWFATSEHFFTLNVALEMERYSHVVGKQGALVGLPNRHTAVFHPINNLDVVKAVNVMIPVINRMYNEGPGSVSPNLYWYINGDFIQIPYKLTENSLQVSPPNRFAELLNELGNG